MSAPELLWTGKLKEMALTCNVETVCRRLLYPGVWPVDPIRVGSRLNPLKLLCTSVRTRGAGSSGLQVQNRGSYSRHMGTTRLLLGIVRYVYMWPGRSTDCTAHILGKNEHIPIGYPHYPSADENSISAASPGYRGTGT